jgi:hypothetical protein
MNTNIKDYIQIVDVTIPDSVLNLCIESENEMRKAMTASGSLEYRDCYENYINPDMNPDMTPEGKDLYEFLHNTHKNLITGYIAEFNIPKDIIQIHHTGFHILKYENFGKYKEHIDDFGSNYFSFRRLSMSILLNDNYTGGEFSFFNDQYRISLKKNQAIIFPSNFMFPHQILPVTSGSRWSIVSWTI